MSQRIYYKDLEPDAESILKKDLELYNCMLHKAFKICSDYFPLSAINEAKALVKSLKCREIEMMKCFDFIFF